MDCDVRDAWLDIVNPILFLFFQIIIKLFLEPVRRAIIIVIIDKGASIAGLLALFKIKQISRSFINNSAILFVVVQVVGAIIATHRRWIY